MAALRAAAPQVNRFQSKKSDVGYKDIYQRQHYQPPVFWPAALGRLFKKDAVHIDKKRFGTVIGLLTHLVKDPIAGLVLYQLLHWQHSGARKDKFVWKTDKEIHAEIYVSPSQMNRIRLNNALKPMVIFKKMKANGSMTWHYKIDDEQLLKTIAEIIGKSRFDTRPLLFRKLQITKSTTATRESGIATQDTSSSNNTDSTLTHSLSKDKEQTPIQSGGGVDSNISLLPKSQVIENATDDPPAIKKLLNAGVRANLARAYPWIPEATVDAIIADANAKPDIRNRGSWIAGALKNSAKAFQDNYKRKIAHGTQITFEEFIQSETGNTPQPEIIQTPPVEDKVFTPNDWRKPTEPQFKYDNPTIGDHPTATIWDITRNQLQAHTTNRELLEYLRHAKFAGLDSDTFVIMVNSNRAKTIFEGRYSRNICNILAPSLGIHADEVKIRFELQTV